MQAKVDESGSYRGARIHRDGQWRECDSGTSRHSTEGGRQTLGLHQVNQLRNSKKGVQFAEENTNELDLARHAVELAQDDVERELDLTN